MRGGEGGDVAVRAMSGRSYLSIGDVLSLLREEFPDVTISKIRFLESQGLVDPERSPSGYRKFYDEDVARLRWVLRKQRDQFLPLKVIRDRLVAAGAGVPPDDEPISGSVAPEDEQLTDDEQFTHGARVADGARVSDGVPGWDAAAETAPPPVVVREGARVVVGAGAQARSAALGAGAWPVAEREGDDSRAAPAATAAPMAAAPLSATPMAAADGDVWARSRPRGEPRERGAAPTEHDPGPRATAPAAAPAPASFVQADQETGHRSASGGAAAFAHGPGMEAAYGSGAAGVLSPSVSGVSLTLAELCAATGLTPEVVANLESLGLLSPISIAGGSFYDEEALTVGKLVSEFARYGVEPRHLRMYRNAADREGGLVEQVITPLLRQRNPEARQRAVEAAADLARLGQSLRASLVRSGLRRQLGS